MKKTRPGPGKQQDGRDQIKAKEEDEEEKEEEEEEEEI